MSDQDWEEGGEVPAKKRRVPLWVWWGCGGGCLLMALLGIALAVLIVPAVREALDPEKTWENVQELLPFDERPEGWDAMGVSVLGFSQYTLEHPEPGVLLFLWSVRKAEELEMLFDPEARSLHGPMLFSPLEDERLGTFPIQGREVRSLVFHGGVPDALPNGQRAAGVRLDLSGGGRNLVLQVSTVGSETELSAERVAAWLQPFDIWRGR
jgi:hypothetical protein